MSNRRLFTILAAFLCAVMTLLTLSGCKTATKATENQIGSALITSRGYTFVEYEGNLAKGDAFLACGTGGRLDRIYTDGTVENIPLPDQDKDLTCILVGTEITLVSGCSGTLLYSLDGQTYTKCKNVTDADIVGLTLFQNKYFAAAVDGTVYSSDDGESWTKCADLSIDGIISFASTADYLSAITSATDIFVSTDGINWDQQNFNVAYEGYYDKYVFTKMIGDEYALAILGHSYDNPGAPVLMTSTNGGEVWMFQSFAQINEQDTQAFFPLSINYVLPFADGALAACNKGRILTLTSCPKCSLISDVAQNDLHCLSINDSMSTIVAVGNDFEFAVLDALDYRPD